MSLYILVPLIYLACFCVTGMMRGKRSLICATIAGMAISGFLLFRAISAAGGNEDATTLFIATIAASLGFFSGFLARSSIRMAARKGSTASPQLIGAIFLIGMPALAYGYVFLRFTA